MKRFFSFVAAALLTVGGFTLVGCESKNPPGFDDHDALFGGGNGEFGESPRIAGDYSNQTHANPATAPLPATNSDQIEAGLTKSSQFPE